MRFLIKYHLQYNGNIGHQQYWSKLDGTKWNQKNWQDFKISLTTEIKIIDEIVDETDKEIENTNIPETY